jgi:hypothetical protein
VKNQLGFIDRKGRWAIPPRYDYPDPWLILEISRSIPRFSEGLAAVFQGGKFGYVDRRGKIAIPFQFAEAGDFAEGLAPVAMGGERGYINRAGEFVWREKKQDLRTLKGKSHLFCSGKPAGRWPWGSCP